jgi:integrase
MHYHYAFSIRGNRHRGALPEARTQFQAEQAEVKIKNEIFEGRFGKPDLSHQKLDQFIEEVYLPWARQNKRSWKSDEYRIKAITRSESFRGKTFAEISPLTVEKYKQERAKGNTMHGRPRNPLTVNTEMITLSRVFTMAVDNQIIDSNPCRKVKRLRIGEERARVLEQDEELRLLEQLTGWRSYLLPIVLVAIYTGMRRGEILSLTWSRVDFTRNLIFVTETKWPGDPRRKKGVPMNDLVRNSLLALHASATSDLVFSKRQGGKRHYGAVVQAFQRACRDAGIHGLRFHDLRHTFGTRLGELGVSPFTIAELMGHCNIKQTSRYVHPTDPGRAGAVKALNDARGAACHKIATGAFGKAQGRSSKRLISNG